VFLSLFELRTSGKYRMDVAVIYVGIQIKPKLLLSAYFLPLLLPLLLQFVKSVLISEQHL